MPLDILIFSTLLQHVHVIIFIENNDCRIILFSNFSLH